MVLAIGAIIFSQLWGPIVFRWFFQFKDRCLAMIFSVTRRSRSDESHSLTESLTESWLADSTDVTLVSEDTY